MGPARKDAQIRKTHALLAALFVFVMLVEWGAHSLAFAHSQPAASMVAVDVDDEHDDPCRSMTCCERRKSDKPASSFLHDLRPPHSFVQVPFDAFVPVSEREASPILREDVHRIFRPSEPPVDPPEFS